MLTALSNKFAEYVIVYDDADSWSDWWNDWFMAMAWLWLIVAVIMIAAMWRIFTKAGRPGWAALVPIYNSLQTIWTAGKPWWWLLMFLIPIVNVVFAVMLAYNLAKAFGKGVGYTLLILFLPIIGYPMLAWGDAKYRLKKPKTGY